VEGERNLSGLQLSIRLGSDGLKSFGFDVFHTRLRALIDFGRVYLPVSEGEYLYFLAVMPGISRQLIKFAEFQARIRGLKKIILDVEVDNKRARRLYERLGYRISEVVTDSAFYERSGIKGAIRMAKLINPA